MNTIFQRFFVLAATVLSVSSSLRAQTLAVGQTHQGGKIAYVLQSTDPGFVEGQTRGLIVTASDQIKVPWANGTNTTHTGTTGVALGTGNSNTEILVAAQGEGTYAARSCYDLVLNGYSDWYLPSKDEMYKIYLNRVTLAFYIYAGYWISSEHSIEYAWQTPFGGNGGSTLARKDTQITVRCVRSF